MWTWSNAIVAVGSEGVGRMFRNGSFLMSRIFESGDEARASAEEERQQMAGHGWSIG